MKKITKITLVVLTVFVIGMTMGMAFADPVSATKYKGKKSLTVNVKDGKKNIKIKCKYKSKAKAYEGKKGKYTVTVWKGPSQSPNYKGWNTQAKNTKNWKVGSKLGKNKPVTSIRIG